MAVMTDKQYRTWNRLSWLCATAMVLLPSVWRGLFGGGTEGALVYWLALGICFTAEQFILIKLWNASRPAKSHLMEANLGAVTLGGFVFVGLILLIFLVPAIAVIYSAVTGK